jgi:hypothetical protein
VAVRKDRLARTLAPPTIAPPEPLESFTPEIFFAMRESVLGKYISVNSALARFAVPFSTPLTAKRKRRRLAMPTWASFRAEWGEHPMARFFAQSMLAR